MAEAGWVVLWNAVHAGVSVSPFNITHVTPELLA